MSAPGEVFALADAHFNACVVVEKFINEHVRLRVEGAAQTTPVAGAAFGLLLRTIAWLRTAAKLKDPADFQASTAGARATFETALDLTLLHFDRTGCPIQKLEAWQRSAKLHHASAIVRYQEKQPPPPPTAPPSVMAHFVRRDGPAIEAERAQYWPAAPGKKAKHPGRWTGRNLDQDAVAADGLAPRRFVEFYECSYRQFCWNTHGSGLTGLDLSIDLVPSLTLFAFKELGHFAIVAAEMAVRLAGAWDAEMERLFGEVGVVRERAVAMVFGKHKGVGPLATKDPAK